MKRFLAILAIFGLRAFQGVQNIVTKNPEKSRDFSFKNPGILADLKSLDPGIPGIPLSYDAVSANVVIWVLKMGESESGQMVSEKLKWA